MTTQQYTASELARELHLTPLQVGKIFSSMYPSCRSKMNCGLQIKSTTRGTSNKDYVSRISGKWHYTEQARTLLHDYIKNFRNVANAIGDTQNSNVFIWPKMDAELKMCIMYCRALWQTARAKEDHEEDRAERGRDGT